MIDVLRIAHLRIALHVANPEVGKREVHHDTVHLNTKTKTKTKTKTNQRQRQSD